jgi:hypothetical protein
MLSGKIIFMTNRMIASHRLINQQITGTDLSAPDELVRWMGCMQAQDFAGAKWAIGNRIKGITEAEIDRQFNEGKILRTHILRPTWHFVSPDDIGWILQLTAPKIKAFNKVLHHKLGIDKNILQRSKNIISKALTANKQLTREQLVLWLKKAKINTDDIRSNFLLMDAELDGIICSGGRRGKQFTYALLQERVPKTRHLSQEAAIAALTEKYFVSRGPATLQDFAWWSGLNLSLAKKGIEMNKQKLSHAVLNGQAYWFSAEMPLHQKPQSTIHLLPAFDEYTVAYKDRSDVLNPAYRQQSGNGIFKPTIVINGQIAGTRERTLSKDKVLVTIHPFTILNKRSQDLIKAEARRYARFVDKELVLIA